MAQLYDVIGIGYEHYRRPDRRIAAAVIDALGDAATVMNVGAGARSYEPADRSVVAVEPSLAMIRQRPAVSAPVVQASATHLPFRDANFAAALAILTAHHWADRVRGLTELARVAQLRVVIVTWERRNGHLLRQSELDLGYRLVIAHRRRNSTAESLGALA
jgi:ubiquinone/menaquinone biosynthesis C-methylase UbiE